MCWARELGANRRNSEERNSCRGVTPSDETSTEEILHDSTEPEPGRPAGRPRWWTRRTGRRTAATRSANPEARTGRARRPGWPAGWWRPARRPEPLKFKRSLRILDWPRFGGAFSFLGRFYFRPRVAGEGDHAQHGGGGVVIAGGRCRRRIFQAA